MIKPILPGSRIVNPTGFILSGAEGSEAEGRLIREISNRELVGLEVPQDFENKHRRPALIENFEPNHCFNFRASVQVEKS